MEIGKSVAETITAATQSLSAVGITTAQADAEALLAAVIQVDPTTLRESADKTTLTPAQVHAFARFMERRRGREPVAYITGRCRYFGLDLKIDQRVLVPDEEASGRLVQIAVDRLDSGMRVHDVGTGSGANALAIKYQRPDLIVSGSDISPAAIDVALANKRRTGLDVTFSVAPWLPPGGNHDLVVVNPPQADRAHSILKLPLEHTKWQPDIAVYGGEDGMAMIRGFFSQVKTSGLVAMQHAPQFTAQITPYFRDPETVEWGHPWACVTVGHLVASDAD
jgi:release factor glutamine methyltransferase